MYYVHIFCIRVDENIFIFINWCCKVPDVKLRVETNIVFRDIVPLFCRINTRTIYYFPHSFIADVILLLYFNSYPLFNIMTLLTIY